MTVYEKNSHLFLSGMFWQTPDEGKRSINSSKLIKDTGHNMYCRTRKITPTWGFCNKGVLPKGKNVASLGQFIVECSNVDERTPNSILAYKFKMEGDPKNYNDTEKLEHDLFGYIVFMNGTICPDDGEFVSDSLSLRINILKKLRRYDIKRLDLPVDAAEKLFNIYERFTIAYSQPEALYMMLNISSAEDKNQLKTLIEQNSGLEKYSVLLENYFDLNYSPEKIVELLRQLTREPAFIDKRQNSREEKDDLYVLPEKINIAPLTSDDIYWNHKNFKKNYAKALIKPMSSAKNGQIKIIAGAIILGISGYFAFGYKKGEELPFMPVAVSKPLLPTAVLPQQLITACLTPNDRFFTDLVNWTFTGIKCNSLGYTLNFAANIDTTLSDFIRLTGDKDAVLTGKTGTVTKKYQLISGNLTTKHDRQEIINNFQAKAIEFGMRLQLPATRKDNKFTLITQLSPVYLLNHQVLDDIKLSEITMSFEKQSGYYNWTIKGNI